MKHWSTLLLLPALASSCADAPDPEVSTQEASASEAAVDEQDPTWAEATPVERSGMLEDLQRDVLRVGMRMVECRAQLGEPDWTSGVWSFDLSTEGLPPESSQSLRIAVGDGWPVASLVVELVGQSHDGERGAEVSADERARLLREIDARFLEAWCASTAERTTKLGEDVRDWVNHAKPPLDLYRALLDCADRAEAQWGYDVQDPKASASRVPNSLTLEFRAGVLATWDAPIYR